MDKYIITLLDIILREETVLFGVWKLIYIINLFGLFQQDNDPQKHKRSCFRTSHKLKVDVMQQENNSAQPYGKGFFYTFLQVWRAINLLTLIFMGEPFYHLLYFTNFPRNLSLNGIHGNRISTSLGTHDRRSE